MTELQWETSVPLFKNRFILRGLALAFGLPLAGVVIFLLISSGGSFDEAKYPLLFIGFFLAVAFLAVLLIFGGAYRPGYILDGEGITNYTQTTQTKRNRKVNLWLFILGALRGKPGMMGTGLLAQSKETVQIKWKKIRKVKYYPVQRTIMVRGGYTEKIALFCTGETYAPAEAMIRQKAAGAKQAP